MTEYELNSPFINISFRADLNRWVFVGILALWLAFWATVSVGLIYLYAVLFAKWAGFQTTVLVGIALIVLGGSVND